MNAMSPQPSNPGMDADVFEQFYEQLTRYVRERLIPAEPEVIANDRMGLRRRRVRGPSRRPGGADG